MSRGTAPRVLTSIAVVTMVVSVIGFVVALVLNAFFFDEHDAYGEVSVPGSGKVDLPAGEVIISFNTVLIGGSGGSGVPVPQLSLYIVAPQGVEDPVVTEDIGSTTTVNNDARVRVWIAQIAAEGTYEITADGDVGAFFSPRLTFGHGSQYGWLPVLFGGLFGLAAVDLIIARVWAGRVKRSAGPTVGAVSVYPPPTSPTPPAAQPQSSYVPTDQGVRLEQLNTLARLRDSGALTHDEFEAEKKRILEGR